MRVTLVQPPSNRQDTSELAPPLGLLCIAATLQEDDFDVCLVDLNLLTIADSGLAGPDFYAAAATLIAQTGPDVIGFTSMALESHICIELARQLKAMDTHVRVLLGGPHFSAIAAQVLKIYPWIDFVVVGEGELATRELLSQLRSGKEPAHISNVAFTQGGEFRLSRSNELGKHFSELPFPAYNLVNLERYFELNPYRVLDFEHARGCALKCAFCYSPVHWGQGERARTVDRIVEDVHRHYDLGARHLFFVGDNFVNSPKFAKATCDAIAGSNPGLTWRCYATLAQLDEPMVESMARSECKFVFIGVDAVSDRSRTAYRKHYFRGWPRLRESMQRFLDRDMTPTCAFMVTPPTTRADQLDNEAALGAAVSIYNLGCGVRLNPLTVYAGTQLAEQAVAWPSKPSNAKPKLLLDGHWMTQENPLAQQNPDLYPYHCTIGPPRHYEHFIETTHVGFTALDCFPRTLMQWLHHEDGAVWELLSSTAKAVEYRPETRAYWKSAEVVAFSHVVQERMSSAVVAEILEVERAEFELRATSRADSVTLVVDDTRLSLLLAPHARITLKRCPTAYDTTEAVSAKTGEESRYLLLPSGAEVRYLECNEDAHSLVRRVTKQDPTRPCPEISNEEASLLLAAGVLGLYPDQPPAKPVIPLHH
jgi:hypothetical protein